MSKVYNDITLDEVNRKLLRKLAAAIDDTDIEEVDRLGKLTDHVSKLNSSFRNNDQFGRPETDEERVNREQIETFKDALQDGEIVG